jgi:hypothetical protein
MELWNKTPQDGAPEPLNEGSDDLQEEAKGKLNQGMN